MTAPPVVGGVGAGIRRVGSVVVADLGSAAARLVDPADVAGDAGRDVVSDVGAADVATAAARLGATVGVPGTVAVDEGSRLTSSTVCRLVPDLLTSVGVMVVLLVLAEQPTPTTASNARATQRNFVVMDVPYVHAKGSRDDSAPS